MNDDNKEANAITAKEKLTPTYRKYAKELGKLFWSVKSQWDHETRTYNRSWHLIMVSGLYRPSYSNRYSYMLMELEGDKTEYRQQAADFVRNLERGRHVVYAKTKPQRPEPSSSDSWM